MVLSKERFFNTHRFQMVCTFIAHYTYQWVKPHNPLVSSKREVVLWPNKTHPQKIPKLLVCKYTGRKTHWENTTALVLIRKVKMPKGGGAINPLQNLLTFPSFQLPFLFLYRFYFGRGLARTDHSREPCDAYLFHRWETADLQKTDLNPSVWDQVFATIPFWLSDNQLL